MVLKNLILAFTSVLFFFLQNLYGENIEPNIFGNYEYSGKEILDFQNKFDLFIDAPESCRSSMGEMKNLVVNYGYAALKSEKKKAQRFSEEIKSFLFGSQIPSSCFLYVYRTLVTGSMLLLERRNFDVGTRTAKSLEYNRPIPWDITQSLTVAALANINKINPILEIDRVLNGGYWVETIDKKKPSSRENVDVCKKQYKLVGTYNCTTKNILVDPCLDPIDLASVTSHELDHLFRDQFLDLNDLNALFSESDREEFWKAYTLNDEVAAIVGSVLDQLKLQEIRVYNKKAFLLFSDSITPYNINSDRSLYRPDGPMAKLLSKYLGLNEGLITKSKPLRGEGNHFGLLSGVLPNLFTSQSQNELESDLKEYISNIYSVVWNGYFPHADTIDFLTSRPSTPRFFAKENLIGELGKHRIYFGAVNELKYPETLLGFEDQKNVFFRMEQYENVGKKWSKRWTDGYFYLNDFMNFLESDLIARINQNMNGSPTCQSWQKAVKSEQLNGYVKIDFQDGNGGGSGGDGGVKPDDSTIRPFILPCYHPNIF